MMMSSVMLPEVLAPIAFADIPEPLLEFAGVTPLGAAHEITDRDIRRDLDEHMDMITRQGTADDGHGPFNRRPA